MHIFAAYFGKMPHIYRIFGWRASRIFSKKKSRYKPVSLISYLMMASQRKIKIQAGCCF